ncbi:MAG: zf-HC2 domain-containing protein [Verrucomicrobia bacterium]|nr:zf-HC2 domain-containing protein [Verrucomicrobiota bacterium]
MNCQQCQENFDGLLDGRLATPDADAARAHFAACAACGAAWRDYEAAWKAFASAPELEPSSNFVARVMSALDATEREQPASGWILTWPRFLRLGATAAVTAIAVSVASIGLLQKDVNLAMLDQRLHQDLLTELPVIQHLELLKDLDVIRHLDQLSPPVDMEEIEMLLQEILST